MLTILVINSKGGSGKTTLATNLASYYAGKKYRTAIMDYDPQGSSLHWLKTRP
ncbi:MAG: AAA family ATPase, partial [Gallionella sp.]|nr:AAA family ATPase [Gallionella sp.]